MDTANWQDTVILNGVCAMMAMTCDRQTTRSAKVNSDFVNYNVGAVFKPLPIGSLYAAYATSTNPFGSELDATGTRLRQRSAEQRRHSWPRTQQGRRNRHQVGAVRPPPAGDGCAVPYREGQCARDRQTANTLTSGAAYQVEGIDLEVSGKITDRWSVFGGLVLMRSKVTQSGIASQHRAADGQHRPVNPSAC